MMKNTQKRQPTKMNKRTRILLIVLLSLLALFLVLALTVAAMFKHYYGQMNYESVDESIPSLTEQEISEILNDLYGDESETEGSEMDPADLSRLEESMNQLISGGTSADESEESEESYVIVIPPESSDEEPPQESSQTPSNDPSENTSSYVPSISIPSVEPSDVPREGISNVLVLGLDSAATGRPRSDTMIVVTVNEETKKITLTSILRDTYVTIPGYSSNRINASYAFGGVALLKKTIKQNFDIDIDRYVAIDFAAFRQIIDILGGIELELTEKDCKNVFPDQNKPAGTYKLTANEALTYARWRKGSDDFDRTSRQRTVMLTVIDRMLNMSFSELTAVMDQTLPLVTTDLTESDCISILFNAVDLADYKFASSRIPYKGTWSYARINGMSVITLDLEKNRKLFYESTLSQ